VSDQLARLIGAAGGKPETATTAAATAALHVGLRTGTRWFALPAGAVAEVVMLPDITRVPAAPTHVLGVAMIRARLVPIVDLDLLIAGRRTPQVERGRALVVRGDDLEVGLIGTETRGLIALAGGADRDGDAPAERPPWVAREERAGAELYAVIDVGELLRVTLRGGGG
jgi:purine-binding chemotaxis protein CheW